MTFKPSSTLRRSLLALGLAACTSSVFAFPNKAIEMIVPWPAGQEADVMGRALSAGMSKRLGVPVQVINKPGAGGVPGTADLVRAKRIHPSEARSKAKVPENFPG